MATIQRSSMKEQVYDLIRERIFNQYYRFGEEIRILTLSQELGVSNTPIREALNMLTAEGLLTNSLNNKFRVIELNEDSHVELNELIKILLVGGYREAHKDGRDKDLEDMLRSILKRQLDARERGDEDEYIRTAMEFDGSFVRITGNSRLISIYNNYNSLLYLYVRHTYWKEDENRDKKLSEHEELISAVHNGDSAEVERLLEQHYDEHYI